MQNKIILEEQSNRYYLTKQTLTLRKKSLVSAAILYAYFIVMDFVRFAPELYLVTVPVRVFFFWIPLAILAAIYWKKSADDQEIHVWWLTYLYIAAGLVHCFLLYFLDNYQTFFTNTGFVLIILYGCLLTAIPVRIAAAASALLMVVLVIAMSFGSYPALDIVLNAVVYTFFICLCLFISRMCQLILLENFSLIKRLYNESIYDGMTTLYNRLYFDQQLKILMQIGKRDSRKIGLVFLDVDKFKQFNDTAGHIEADEVLKKISACLKKLCRRESDFAARYGGDEFVLVFFDISRASLEKKCASIIDLISALKIKHPKSTVSDWVTVSVGGTIINSSDSLTHQECLKKADESLYVAKENGRNGYHLN